MPASGGTDCPYTNTKLQHPYRIDIINAKIGKDSYRIINVLDFLEDGSLLCLGNIKEKCEAKLMMATPSTLLEEVNKETSRIKLQGNYNLALVINSFIRRDILGLEADKEIEIIKKNLGSKTKIIGFYCDYQVTPEKDVAKIIIENNNLCMVLLKHE